MITFFLIFAATLAAWGAFTILSFGPDIDFKTRNRVFDESTLLSEIDELLKKQEALKAGMRVPLGLIGAFTGLGLVIFALSERDWFGELGEGWLRLSALIIILFATPIYLAIALYGLVAELMLKRLGKKIDEANWKIEVWKNR